jgi:hypothetical protein
MNDDTKYAMPYDEPIRPTSNLDASSLSAHRDWKMLDDCTERLKRKLMAASRMGSGIADMRERYFIYWC